MLTPEERKIAGNVTQITQIIIASLWLGVGAYFGFVLVRQDGGQAAPDAHLAPIGAVVAAGALILSVVLPRFIAAQQRQAVVDEAPSEATLENVQGSDAFKLLAGYQVRRIIRGALLEGAAFLNVFAYQQGRQAYSLAVIAVLLLAIAVLFPLRPLVEDWLDSELRAVRELRSLRR